MTRPNNSVFFGKRANGLWFVRRHASDFSVGVSQMASQFPKCPMWEQFYFNCIERTAFTA